mgnify:CR=1 FL=1
MCASGVALSLRGLRVSASAARTSDTGGPLGAVAAPYMMIHASGDPLALLPAMHARAFVSSGFVPTPEEVADVAHEHVEAAEEETEETPG